MKKPVSIWRKILLISVWVVLIIGVPFIINEAYKFGKGYVTMWSAEDVLSYYGTITAGILGVVGVFYTVKISSKQYRDDARIKMLPYMAISVNSEELKSTKINQIFFILDGRQKDGTSKIEVMNTVDDIKKSKFKPTQVRWLRATKDGKLYIRGQNTDVVNMPFIVENIGFGTAKGLKVSLSYHNGKRYFRPEVILKPNEQYFIHIFSEENFNKICGEYDFIVCYEDISGNAYEQHFLVEIVFEEGKRYYRIDPTGEQILTSKRTMI